MIGFVQTMAGYVFLLVGPLVILGGLRRWPPLENAALILLFAAIVVIAAMFWGIE